MKYPVLLIGYNRPEKIFQRTKQILSWDPSELFISIDGGRSEAEEIITHEIRMLMEDFQSDPRVKLIFREKNYGLREHIPIAVDEVLQIYEGVIVIEDDIKCGSKFYDAMCSSLNTHGRQYMTIGGFSSISIHPTFLLNRWRKTKYFSAWGWGVSRESWSKFIRKIELDTIQSSLDESQIWGTLNFTQRNTWIGRFNKVAKEKNTWDFQMQYSSFVHNLYHLNTLFRICENVGFDDTRGVNTKSRRPYYLGAENLSEVSFTKRQLPKFLSLILEGLDSVVIAGDRVFFHKITNRAKGFWKSMN